MSFPARYRSRCDNCGERVEIGELIRFDELFGTRIIHDVCPDPTEHRAPICDRCFTEKPCACDDEDAS